MSTDFDECDRLYFEEISFERVLDIYQAEQVWDIYQAVVSYCECEGQRVLDIYQAEQVWLHFKYMW